MPPSRLLSLPLSLSSSNPLLPPLFGGLPKDAATSRCASMLSKRQTSTGTSDGIVTTPSTCSRRRSCFSYDPENRRRPDW